MKIKEWAKKTAHAKNVIERYCFLSDAELLAILIGSGNS